MLAGEGVFAVTTGPLVVPSALDQCAVEIEVGLSTYMLKMVPVCGGGSVLKVAGSC